MIRRPRLAAMLFLGLGGMASAAPALSDIPGETPGQCRNADDLVLCLSKLAERSEAHVRSALHKAREALRASTMISDDARPAALATLERTQKAWEVYVKARCEGEVPVELSDLGDMS
ncbi:lysozyme inhibitor LprI family protein [Methylobacterium brachythecii]|uniref:Lysozyme inhibitor LprI-like N-terminal domain-containing protein n=1 Tax=Methylobacterium brachythecii TaxID=1176177 RepID=A0A7W6F515_9HYPH|nr:lysozyme inhibitor LprI family protein [Methylobacterium brachythecii]MBB3900950.1 hypothetical protein [Methylobacterium brachythecii]GLS47102.1 hypothetical protein GCM10007884_51060 [Methylobacterium brachythecii]